MWFTLQTQSEYVLNQINNQVATLPAPTLGHSRKNHASSQEETMYDLKYGGAPVARIPETKIGNDIKQITGPTPGQSVSFLYVKQIFIHSHI